MKQQIQWTSYHNIATLYSYTINTGMSYYVYLTVNIITWTQNKVRP